MNETTKYCPYCMTAVTDGESCPVCGLTAGTYVPPAHHLRPGTILMDRYLVGRALGEGGFGITYIGCDLRLELKVAIKEYYPVDKANRNSEVSQTLSSSILGSAREAFERGKRKFLQEARTMAKMDKQQAIVSARDFFEANNTAYIVMEFIEGTTFTELVAQKGGRLPPQEFFPVIEPIFKALSTLHDHGLIHRDISPDNLMLENGEVRLIDFGCARESGGKNETLTITLKHGYAPIEQYQQKGQGPWTDVYALCATIYYCLVGQKPPQALDRIGGDTVLMLPSKLGVAVTPGQEAAILKGLNLSPRGRFQSMEELHGALYPPMPIPKPGEDRNSWPPLPDDTEEDQKDSDSARKLDKTTEVRDQEKSKTESKKSEKPKPVPVPKRRRPWLWGVGAVAVLLLCLLPALLGKPTEQKVPDPPASLQWSAFSGDEAQLRSMLADDSVEAISIGGYVQVKDEPLELNKPLRVEKGAGIELSQFVTVGEGGILVVEGNMDFYGLLRVQGGQIQIEPEATFNGMGLLLEHRSDVALPQGQKLEDTLPNTEITIFSEEETFANAVHVGSFQELVQALENDTTASIVIDSDIQLEWNLDQTVPVRISPGVTVTGAITEHWNYEENGNWGVDGTVLVNYGTLTAAVQMCDWDDKNPGHCAILNYGTLGEDLFLCPNHDEYWENSGALYNLGVVNAVVAMVDESSFFNMGTLRIGDTQSGLGSEFDYEWLRMENGWLFNSGNILVEGHNGRETTLEYNGKGPLFRNMGLIQLGEYGRLRLPGGRLENYGAISMTANTAFLDNDGLLYNYGTLTIPDKEQFAQDKGILLSWENTDLVDPAHVIRFNWSESPVRQEFAYNEAQLRHYLSDPDCGAVIVQSGVNITLTDDLLIDNSVLAVPVDAKLHFGGHSITVSGPDSGLLIDQPQPVTKLEDGALYVREQGTACVPLLVKEIDVYGDSQLTLIGSSEGVLEGLKLVTESGSQTSNLGWYTLEGADIGTYSDSRFYNTSSLELRNTMVSLNLRALFMNHMGNLTMDENSHLVLRNQSACWLIADNGKDIFLNGDIDNQGWIELNGDIHIGGHAVNQGTIQLTDVLYLEGRLDNWNTFLTVEGSQVEYQEGYTYSGKEPINRPQRTKSNYSWWSE